MARSGGESVGWVGECGHLKAGGLLVQELLSQEMKKNARGGTDHEGMEDDQYAQKKMKRLVIPYQKINLINFL